MNSVPVKNDPEWDRGRLILHGGQGGIKDKKGCDKGFVVKIVAVR